MSRVKRGVIHRKRVNKIMKMAKGYRGSRKRRLKQAKEQILHSLSYAYRDRRNKKRDMRKLWITRINAAARLNGMSYSRLINGLKNAGVEINRKMLSEMAISNAEAFTKLTDIAKEKMAAV
ncbi:MAG: 50S ribosomal protein L20 [Candidatus Eremiobacteraeota bacterium]|nr:50S ribosomal protein L20 [Candidatus Eremiobacteraeota bacterium]